MADRGVPTEHQRRAQAIADTWEAGTRNAVAGFRNLKSGMDQLLLSKDFSGWCRAVVRFRGDLCVASTGTVSPSRDINGELLQVLKDTEPHFQRLLFGIANTVDGGAVVFVWRAGESAPEAFVKSMLAKGNQRVPSLIVQFMFAYLENTYFSEAWWQSLSMAQSEHLESLARIHNPYYQQFRYSFSEFVPWEVRDVQIDGFAVGAKCNTEKG